MHPSSTVEWPEILDQVKTSDYSGTTPAAPFWFGDNQELCEKLTNLVLDGTKTATASLLWAWEQEGEPLPTVGQRDALLNWNNRFVGIVETIQIDVKPFIKVTPEFACLEGEGDLSLDYWRKVHWSYFEAAYQELGRPISERVPVVCQIFNLVHSAEPSRQ